jgi:Uma2 family endonuclease
VRARFQPSTVEADGIVVFHDVSWENYERILEIRGENPVPRIRYLDGELELLRPAKDHEIIKSHIGRLLEDWCINREMEITAVGSWTVNDKNKRCGAEADECYIFGRHPRDRDRPHLTIVVEWTEGGIDKLSIYERLGVDEVWIWRKGVIEIYALANGRSSRTQRSCVVPELDVELLTSMIDRDTLTQAVLDFRKALRPGSV